MTTRYLQKLAEIGKARNSSSTALKMRGVKWTKKQQEAINFLAANEQSPTIALIKKQCPNLSAQKSSIMLDKVKKLRKKLSLAVDERGQNISGLRNSKGKGLIYLIEHESYQGWVKCGMTVNMKTRLSTYNCSDPLKRFVVIVEKSVANRKQAEKQLIHDLGMTSALTNGEWFKIEKEKAIEIFKNIK